MNWNKFDEVGPPEKDRFCWVYKPNNRFCKFTVDEWIDLYESPVSWSSATICVGEGWADEGLENEIEVEDYHLYQSDDPNDIYPQEPWAW